MLYPFIESNAILNNIVGHTHPHHLSPDDDDSLHYIQLEQNNTLTNSKDF